MLYKYPRQHSLTRIADGKRTLGKKDPEYEIQDTCVFDENKYLMFLLNMQNIHRTIYY